MQLLRGDRTDSPQRLDRQRMQERELAVRRDDEQPVGLCHTARDLRKELRPRHPDGNRQADSLADVAPQTRGDLDGRARDPSHPADVEERLVDRQSLDDGRGVVEDAEQRLARVRIRGHPRRDDDRVRTELQCLPAAHRRPDAVRLGLVARCEDDAGADDHRAAAERWIVPLLDRGVEGVDVGVKDRRLVRHERMFAHGSSLIHARDSRTFLSRRRSFRLARRIAVAITGTTILENPVGSPRLRSVIFVAPAGVSAHV